MRINAHLRTSNNEILKAKGRYLNTIQVTPAGLIYSDTENMEEIILDNRIHYLAFQRKYEANHPFETLEFVSYEIFIENETFVSF